MKFSIKPAYSLSFIAIATMLIFNACKKDCPAPVVPLDLAGSTWIDSANVSGIPYKPFTIVFNADGTAAVTFQGFSAFPGTWSKTPNSSVVYIFFDENATTRWKGQGTLNATNTKIEAGTLTRLTPSTINGTFRVTKQ